MSLTKILRWLLKPKPVTEQLSSNMMVDFKFLLRQIQFSTRPEHLQPIHDAINEFHRCNFRNNPCLTRTFVTKLHKAIQNRETILVKAEILDNLSIA